MENNIENSEFIKKVDKVINLLDKQNNELNPNIKKQLDEDIHILLTYL